MGPLTDDRDGIQKGPPELGSFVLCAWKGVTSSSSLRQFFIVARVLSYQADPTLLDIHP